MIGTASLACGRQANASRTRARDADLHADSGKAVSQDDIACLHDTAAHS
jgi:hypothetical protein